MTDKESNDLHSGAIQVQLVWEDPSVLPTLYANQAYVSHVGKEFYVIFGEAQIPVLTHVDPDALHEVKVKPVAKLVFTPEGISGISKALADNVRRFHERQEREGEKE